MTAPLRDPCASVRYVLIRKYSELCGLTKRAVQRLIETGAWHEGEQYHRAPDGNVMVHLDAAPHPSPLAMAIKVSEIATAYPHHARQLAAAVDSGKLPTGRYKRHHFVRREELLDFVGRLKEPDGPEPELTAPERDTPPMPSCGVYILFLSGDVVYVGRSTTLRSRLATHRSSGREFDEARVIPCDEAVSIWLEKELIRTLQPSQNLMRYQRHTRVTEGALAWEGLH